MRAFDREVRPRRRHDDDSSDGDEQDPRPVQYLAFPESTVVLSVQTPMVEEGGALNFTSYPNTLQFGAFFASGTDMMDVHGQDGPVEHQMICDDLSHPAPFMANVDPMKPATYLKTGCKRHGPFQCSCRFITQTVRALRGMCNELGLATARESDGGSRGARGRSAGFGGFGGGGGSGGSPLVVRMAESFVRNDFGAILDALGDEQRNHPHGVIVVTPESFTVLITNQELPLSVQRRKYGPLKLGRNDSLETVQAAVLAAETEAATQLDSRLPRCIQCKAARNLKKCKLCGKRICTNCAFQCIICVYATFCPHCVVQTETPNSDESSEVSQFCTECLPERFSSEA